MLELQSQDLGIIFLEFDDVDHLGHGDPATLDIGGFCPYTNGDIGDILQALYVRPVFQSENWLIMVSPDHGAAGVVFNQRGFPIDQERRTFLIMSGEVISSFPESIRAKIVDITVTAAANLDGQAIALRGAPPYTDWAIPTRYDPAILAPDSGSGRSINYLRLNCPE